MKKQLLSSLLIAVLAFAISPFAQGQSKVSTVDLPEPEAFKAMRTQGSFASDDDAGTLYYGSTPSNSSNKPVLLFVHGYSSSASTWWGENEMYVKAYYAGYRTAFASLYPDENSFTNGQMLASMINAAAARYGVNKVAIVAHSKGGVDTDAAMVHYGAYNKVSRVLTLGSPHFGTPLADLAQSGWVWWLSAVFGQFNNGTAQLQTGAMSQFRSITDNHPNNNVDVRTIGAWGYGGVLWTPGIYLNVNGGGSGNGGNDGVVPYYSTLRPRATHLYSGYGDSRTDLDHFEVAEGQYVWNYVNAQMSSASSYRESAVAENSINPTAKITSHAQVITSNRGQRSFFVEPGATKVVIDVKQGSPYNVSLRNANGVAVSAKRVRNKELSNDIFTQTYSTTFELNRPSAGAYTIDAPEGFVAIVATEGGISTTFSSDLNDEKYVYEVGEVMNFQMEIEGSKGLKGATVSAVMIKTSDLEGTPSRGDEAYVVEFENQGNGTFRAKMDEFLTEGVYNLSIEAQGRNFRKSTITSIAVVNRGGQGNGELEDEIKPFELLSSYPNPFSGSTKIQFEIKKESNASLTIYDMYGRAVESFDLSEYAAGQYEVNWVPAAGLNSGMYIYEINNGEQRIAKRMIYNK